MDRDQAPQQQSGGAAAPVVDEAPRESKTKAMVGNIQGYDAQAAALSPNKDAKTPVGADAKAPAGADAKAAPGAEAKAAPGAEAKTPAPDEKAPPSDDKQAAAAQGVPAHVVDGDNVEKLSPIREAMMKQFELMEGKGVGDKEFDSVCSEATWKKMKAEEALKKEAAEKKYADAMEKWNALDADAKKKTPKPQKDYVPIYTTCIDTMGAISRAAWKASGLAVKRIEGKNFDQFAFGGASRTEGKKLGVWEESKPNSGKTPKPGDMLMLEKAGSKLDNIGAEDRNLGWTMGPKIKKLETQIEQLKQASQAADEAKAAASSAKATQLEGQLSKLKADYAAAQQALVAKKDQLAADLAKKMEGGAKLEFSHVGFFKGATPEQKDGAPTGRQIWQTFDGGQSGIAGAVDGQGAKSGTRYYDPKTNLISGEASQGASARWLAGWIDLDKMVKEPEKKTP